MINVRKIFGTTESTSTINWKDLNSEASLQEAIDISSINPVVIFKHSSRCSLSSMAKSRLEKGWVADDMTHVNPYFLDLISYRNISNLVAEKLNITHESPTTTYPEKW